MGFQSMIDADCITTITELAERQDDNHFKALASACLLTKNQYDQYHPRFWLALDALIFQMSKDNSHLDTLETLLLWSLELKEDILGKKSLMLSPLLRQLVFLYCLKLDCHEAYHYAERLLSICSTCLPPRDQQVLDALYLLASIEHKLGNVRAAEHLYIRILKNLTETLTDNSQTMPIQFDEVAVHYQRLLKNDGRTQQAALLASINISSKQQRDRGHAILNMLSEALAEKTEMSRLD